MTNLNNVLNRYSNGEFHLFDFEKKDREYINLKDLQVGDTFVIEALFVNTGGNYGPQGVVVTSDLQINLPQHLTDKVEQMKKDADVVNVINERQLAIKVYEYETKQGRKGRSVNFIKAPSTQGRAFDNSEDLAF
jgi:hypothetical protein